MIRWILGIAVVLGGAALGMVKYRDTVEQHRYATELADLKRDFVTETAPMHQLASEDYQKEIGPHLRNYFKGLRKLERKYPELYEVDRERRIGNEKLAAGKLNQSHKEQRDERIDMTMQVFEKMMQGQYRPLYTVTDKGFRFDIFDISPTSAGNVGQVKFSFVHWGPFTKSHKPGQGGVTYRSILGNILAEQVDKKKPAELSQIVGDAQPPSLQINPERWVAEFIPGVEIGHYTLPQFPSVAESITLTFGFGLRTAGGSDISANIEFPAMPIPDAWKAPEGEKWENQERFATDDELRAGGVEPTQD